MKTVNYESIAPVLNVNSRTMKPTIELFTDKLGFTVDTVVGKQPAFAMLKKDSLSVMLFCRPAIPWPHKGWATYIWVNDVDTLHADLLSRDAPIKVGPHNRDYGVRELEVLTPDGRQIVFGQPINH